MVILLTFEKKLLMRKICILLLVLATHSTFGQFTYNWATKFSGKPSFGDRLKTVKDNLGNVYAIGEYQGIQTFGSITLNPVGYNNIYVAKFDPSGACIWAIAGSNPPSGIAYSGGITMDNNYNIYITGYFSGLLTIGVNSVTATGSNDAFLAKLDNSGNCIWLKHFGGNYEDIGVDVDFNTNGFLHVTGTFTGQIYFDGYTTTNTSNTVADIFIAKSDLNGNCVNLKKAGGAGSEVVTDIKIDNANQLLITGYYESGAIFGGSTLTSQGAGDLFVAKYDDVNQYLTWIANGGGHGNDPGTSVGVDAANNVYVTGSIGDTANIGGTVLLDNGYGNIFVAKLSSSGTWQWAKKAGGSGTDGGAGIYTNAGGISYVTGTFHGTANFAPTVNIVCTGGANDNDAFVAMYTSIGNLVYVTKVGGTSTDVGKSIIGTNNGVFHLAGDFSGTVIIGPQTLTTPNFTWSSFLTFVNGPTAIDDISGNSNEIDLFPNPADESISISCPVLKTAFTVEVLNSVGQVVTEITSLTAAEIISVDTEKLPAGIYFIKCSDNSQVYYRKFLITHPAN